MTQNYPGVAQPQKIIELNEALKPQLNCMLHLSAASECEEQQWTVEASASGLFPELLQSWYSCTSTALLS